MTGILNICDKRQDSVASRQSPVVSVNLPSEQGEARELAKGSVSDGGKAPTDIVKTARTWLHTPFRHQGRAKGVGVDCLGLILGVAAELGLPVEGWDEPGYGHYPDAAHLRKRLGEAMWEIAEPEPGAIGLFRVDGRAQHLGIFGVQSSESGVQARRDQNTGLRTLNSELLTVIHAYAPARKVVEHRFCEEWRGRLVTVFAFPRTSDRHISFTKGDLCINSVVGS